MKDRKPVILMGIFAAVLSLSLVLLSANSTMAEWKGVTLKVCSSWSPPDVEMATNIGVVWEELITKRTNGKVKFKNYWGGVLGKGPEQLTLVQNRAVDITLSFAWYTPGKLPLSNFDYVIPFAPIDPLICATVKRKLFEEFPQFKENLAKYNCMRIYNTPGSVYQILSKDRVDSLADMKGKKCALIGRYFGKWVSPIGVSPVVTPSWERYTMLETGVIDMTLDPIGLTDSTKNYERAPWVIENLITRTAWNELWMNLDSFNALPPDVQKIFVDTGKEIEILAATSQVPDWEKKIWKTWKEKGLQWTHLSDQDMETWVNSIEDIPAEWAAEVTAKGYPGWEIIRRYMEITTEMGHKWPRQWGVKK